MRELQKIDAEFPLQYALCFGIIALDEGLSISDLAERAGLSLSTVSRVCGALSTKRQKGRAFDLIKVNICAEERRRKELFLTVKGRAILHGIEYVLDQHD